jgi:hypothetical protein
MVPGVVSDLDVSDNSSEPLLALEAFQDVKQGTRITLDLDLLPFE